MDYNPKPEHAAAFEAFLDWVKLPRRFREPKTMREFAEHHGVSYRLVQLWKYNDKVRAHVMKQRAGFADQHMPEIIKAMIDTAKTPGRDGSADRKLIMEWLGYTKGDGMTVNIDNRTQNLIAPAHTPDDMLVKLVMNETFKGTDIPDSVKQLVERTLLGSLEVDRGNDQDLQSLGRVDDADFELIENDDSGEGEVSQGSVRVRSGEDEGAATHGAVEP